MQSGSLYFYIAPVIAELTKAGSSPFRADTHTSARFPKGVFPLIPPPIHIKFPSEPRPKITFFPQSYNVCEANKQILHSQSGGNSSERSQL